MGVPEDRGPKHIPLTVLASLSSSLWLTDPLSRPEHARRGPVRTGDDGAEPGVPWPLGPEGQAKGPMASRDHPTQAREPRATKL